MLKKVLQSRCSEYTCKIIHAIMAEFVGSIPSDDKIVYWKIFLKRLLTERYPAQLKRLQQEKKTDLRALYLTAI